MIQDEYIQTLIDLELSLLQAKTYINLARLGEADVRTISKASSVARTDTYRVMLVLEKLGLAEKIIAKKTMYKATPIKEGISILLQNKKKEYAELEQKTGSLLNSLNDNDLQDIQVENQKFIITSERSLFQKRFEKSFLEAQTCEMLVPAEGLKFALFYFFQCIKMAIKKGAKIRMITEKTEVGLSSSRKLQTLRKNPLFEIKSATSPIKIGLTIFNNKEVNLCLSSNSEIPSLYTDNPQAVEAAKMLFEAIWNSPEINEKAILNDAGLL
jgi:sugar-specific transcriptional regulator TrmB